MLTSTDPRNATTTYNYDSYNRLSYVQDKDNNVVSKYEYRYSGNKATITCSGDILPNVTKTATVTLSESYASNNYLYEWTLKNSVGSIISSSSVQTSGITNTFSFTPTVTGAYTLDCKITELSTKYFVTDTKTIICFNPLSSVSIITNSKVCTNTTNTAVASLVGGSGNFTYAWRLFASTTPATTLVSGSSSTFNFSTASTGSYTLECKVTDNIIGTTITTSSAIAASSILSVGNNFCNIASSAKLNGNSFDVALIMYSSCALSVGTTYCIGSSQCAKPLVAQTKTITFNNQTWNITFTVDGTLLLVLTSGSAFPSGKTINPATISFSLK